MTVASVDYWNYDNGAAEVREKTMSDGSKVQMTRNIFGPAPKAFVVNTVKGASPIDPGSDNWQDEVVRRLAAERFSTQGINQGVPYELREPGWGGWFLSKATLKNVAIAGGATVAIVGGFAVLYHGKALYQLYGKPLAEKAGFKVQGEGKDAIVTDENSGDEVTVKSDSQWKEAIAKFSEDHAHKILGIGLMAAGSVALYMRAEKEVKAESFSRWKEKLVCDVVKKPKEGEESGRIPEKFQEDEVLSQHICPITTEAIRHPYRSIEGVCSHIFEQFAIKHWCLTQMARMVQTTCPSCRRDIDLSKMEIDKRISDMIELRLLLLKSQST